MQGHISSGVAADRCCSPSCSLGSGPEPPQSQTRGRVIGCNSSAARCVAVGSLACRRGLLRLLRVDSRFPVRLRSGRVLRTTRKDTAVVALGPVAFAAGIPAAAAALFAAGGILAGIGPTASLSGALLRSPAARLLMRNLIRLIKPLLSGPLSVVVIVFAVVGTAVAAIRARIQASVKACTACKGYGIKRCTLCSGQGVVGWEGKWNHKEPCPMCLARRYVNCPTCGGLYHRSTFVHVRSQAQKLFDMDTMAPRNVPSEYITRLTGD